METTPLQEDIQPRRNWYRIIGIVAGVMAILLLAVFFSGRLLVPVVRKAVAEQFAVPVQMGQIRVRVFPGPSFRVEDLVIPGRHADTLLSAKTLFLRVKLLPLLRQHIVIPAVAISDARVRIDRTGSRPNYDDILAPGTEHDTSEKYTLEIDRILIENTHFNYIHTREQSVVTTLAAADIRWTDDGAIRDIRPELFFADTRIFAGKDTIPLDRLAVYGKVTGNRYEGSWTADGLTVHTGKLEYETHAIFREKSGGWTFEEPDGHLEGPLADLHGLLGAWMPVTIQRLDGDIEMDIRYPGGSELARGTLTIDRGAIAMDGMAALERLDGQAQLEYNPSRGQLELSDVSLKGRYGGDPWLFSGKAGYRKSLKVAGMLEATIDAANLPLTGGLRWTGGRVAVDLDTIAIDLAKKDWPFAALGGRMLADELAWTMDGKDFELDGPLDLVSASEFAVEDLRLVAAGEAAELKGKITRNMASGAWGYELEAKARELTVDKWLAGEDERMGGGEEETTGEDERMREGEDEVKGESGDGVTGRELSGKVLNISGVVEAEVDRLYYKKATFREVRIASRMLPGGEHLELSGEGFGGKLEVELDWPTGFPGVLDIRLEGIAIDDALRDLDNLGQDFIRANQVDGQATALATVTLPAIREKWADELDAEIAVQIGDGRLRDMELMEHFSGVVELSELRNLAFSELTNVFSWRNGTLFIPAMRIQSNVADLAIAGRHQTGSAYHYDIRLDGGSVLSKQSRKRRDLRSEKEGWLQLYYHIEGDEKDWSYRADKRHVQEALDASDLLRADVIRKLRERFGPDPLLIRTIEWRKIPEYHQELEGAKRSFGF